MITPDEIKKKATRKYNDFLKAVLSRQAFFPLSIKGKKGSANMPLEVLFPSLKLLLEGAKDKLGFGYEVRLKTVNTRHAGAISMPDDIYFDNLEDYLQYIGKETEFIQFQKTILPTLRKVPALNTWVQNHPAQAIKHLDKWADLVKVCHFFIQQPQPKCYIRQLPIDISPTFIDQNKSILKDLLSVVLPKKHQTNSSIFEERFSLRYDAPTMRMRLLDSNVLTDFPAFVEDINLPFLAFQKLHITAETVFLIEDKTCFLAFPKHTKSVAIWTVNHSAVQLQQLACLHSKQVLFWGDLSPLAFQKLNALRSFLPQVQSLLMNPKTSSVFEKKAIQQSRIDTIPNLPHLNAEEKECLSFLKKEPIIKTLAQKEITQTYLIKTLKQL